MIQPWSSGKAFAEYMAAASAQQAAQMLAFDESRRLAYKARADASWPPNERVRGMTTRQFRHHLAALAEQDKRKLREYRRKLSDAW